MRLLADLFITILRLAAWPLVVVYIYGRHWLAVGLAKLGLDTERIS